MLHKTAALEAYLPAPEASVTVTDRVVEELRQVWGDKLPQEFQPYYDATKAIWPTLADVSVKAVKNLAMEVYIEIAEAQGFMLSEEFLRRKK